MANKEHLELLLKGVGKWNKWRELNPDIKPDFSDVDLRGAYLYKTDLRGANLHRTDFCDANLISADLRGADLSGADLSATNLRYADLHDADLRDANLSSAGLSDADLSDANLSSADLSDADLNHACLKGTNMRKTILKGANLNNANLSSSDLEKSNLEGADISGANIYNIKTLGWKIEGIICTHIYCYQAGANEEERKNSRVEFEEGEFEARYRTMPTIELVLSGGFRHQDHYKMDHIIKKVRDEYGAELEITAIKKVFKGMAVILESKSDKELEEMGRMIVREYKNRDLDSRLLAAIKDQKILGHEDDKSEVHQPHKVDQIIHFSPIVNVTVTSPVTGPININFGACT